MIRTKLTLLAFLILPFIASADPTSEIQSTFNNLDQAVLNKNAQEAFSQLSKESQAYVENILQLALTADKATLSEKPISTILSVFAIRKEAKGQAPTSAADALILMSEDYAKISSSVSLGEITIDGDEANAQMIMNGKVSPMDYAFVKEDGSWKVDLIEQMQATEKLMSQSMGATGAPRKMILDQMARVSQSAGVNIWTPLQ